MCVINKNLCEIAGVGRSKRKHQNYNPVLRAEGTIGAGGKKKSIRGYPFPFFQGIRGERKVEGNRDVQELLKSRPGIFKKKEIGYSGDSSCD